MMKNKKIVLLFLAAVCLSGCTMSPEECDPSNRNAGFLDKFGCTVSGSYSARVEQNQNKLNELKEENARLVALKATIDNEYALVSGSKQERMAQLDKLSSELNKVRSDINRKNAMTDSLKKKLDDLDRQLEEMKKGGDEDILIKKQAEYDKLKKEYEELLEVTSGS